MDIEKAKGYFNIAGGNYILVHWEQCAKYDYVPREICVGIIYGLIWKSSLPIFSWCKYILITTYVVLTKRVFGFNHFSF